MTPPIAAATGAPHPGRHVHIRSAEPIPAGLLDAFWAYDEALLSNDLQALTDLFAPGPHTLRGDGRDILVGHHAITAFRATRGRVPSRHIGEVHVQVVDDHAALTVASTTDGDARGMQTQLWRKTADGWKVSAAHVSAATATTPRSPAPILDSTIWRVAGTPLIRRTRAGSLAGHTFAVKDLFAVAGHRRGAGNPTYLAEQTPETASATAVDALLDAGADLTGIAQTDEFAFSIAGTNAHYGTPPNPAAPGRVSGGSSSGCASAVALGHVTIGLGTDTAGSIRIPASHQGLYGLRTTHGAVDRGGLLALAPSFDVVGWITRDLATMRAVVAQILPGTHGATPTATAVIPHLNDHADSPTRQAFDTHLDVLTHVGTIPRPREIDIATGDLAQWFAAFRTVQAWEAWRQHRRWLGSHPHAVDGGVAERFAAGAAVSTERCNEARAVVAGARRHLRHLLDEAVILMPTTSGTAPHANRPDEISAARTATLQMSVIAAIAAGPAISVPALTDAQGHPVGMSALGAPGTDLKLLDTAATLTAHTDPQ